MSLVSIYNYTVYNNNINYRVIFDYLFALLLRNSPNVAYFWQNWNIPVHRWARRFVTFYAFSTMIILRNLEYFTCEQQSRWGQMVWKFPGKVRKDCECLNFHELK